MIFARIFVWIGAVFFAIFPLGFLLAKEKGLHFTSLIIPEEYDGLKRDLCFVAIAVLVIGLVDAGEAIISTINSAKSENRKKIFFTVPLIVSITMELVIFSAICGSSGAHDSINSQIFYLFISTFVCSAASRVQVLRTA